MARTKRVTAAKKVETKPVSNNAKIAEFILKKIDQQEQEEIEKIDKHLESELADLHIRYSTLKNSFPAGMLDMTIGEIKNGEMLSDITNSQLSMSKAVLSNVTNTFSSTKSTANSTKSGTKNGTLFNPSSTISSSDNSDMDKTRVIRPSRSRTKRSISVGCDDEGYTTAESSRATNSGGPQNKRQSRSKTKAALKQTSRSLSRTNATKGNPFTTPSNKQPLPNHTGPITPKCKPNTPLLYVRRPKMGEMAWSNQGSPILVSGIIAPERMANVNIPVGDNILSVLPTRGPMRQSMFPKMDEDTRKQLQILRDNLIKMCGDSNK